MPSTYHPDLMTALRFRLLPYPAEADAIREAFAALDATLGGASLYQTHARFRHLADGPQPEAVSEPRVLVLEVGSAVASVVALVRSVVRRHGLELAGLFVPWQRAEASAVQLTTSVAFPAARPVIFAFLSREWPGSDVLVWPKQIPISSARLPLGVYPGKLCASIPSGHCCAIPVPSDPAKITTHLSVKARTGFRNARNRLKQHAAECAVCRDPEAALQSGMEEFLELEGAGWKQLTRERWPIFQALAAELAAAGRFQLWRMRVDGQLAAALIGLEGSAGRLGIYKITYAEHLARFSPGRVLLFHVLEELSRSGAIHTVDMMSPAEWLAPWNPNAEPLNTLWCFRPTPRSLAGFMAMAAWSSIRPLVRRNRGGRTRDQP